MILIYVDWFSLYIKILTPFFFFFKSTGTKRYRKQVPMYPLRNMYHYNILGIKHLSSDGLKHMLSFFPSVHTLHILVLSIFLQKLND